MAVDWYIFKNVFNVFLEDWTVDRASKMEEVGSNMQKKKKICHVRTWAIHWGTHPNPIDSDGQINLNSWYINSNVGISINQHLRVEIDTFTTIDTIADFLNIIMMYLMLESNNCWYPWTNSSNFQFYKEKQKKLKHMIIYWLKISHSWTDISFGGCELFLIYFDTLFCM